MPNSGIRILLISLPEMALIGLEEAAPTNTRAGVKSPTLIILVVVATVDFVDWNTVSRFDNLDTNELAVCANKFLPTIGTTIASIDCSGNIIDEKDPEMAVTAFTGSSESSVVLSEINDVVNTDFINLDRTPGAPPFNYIIVEAATRGVDPLEEGFCATPTIKLAANMRRVKFKFIGLFVIDFVKGKTEIGLAGIKPLAP